MVLALFYVYVGICIAMMVSAIWRKEDRVQFPFLAGGTVLLMVCIPLWGLMSDPHGPSDQAIERFLLMAIFCQAASWIGYIYPWKYKNSTGYRFDTSRLAISSVALSLFGFYFAYQLSNIEPEIADNGNWTGLATIFSTLSTVSRYGFVLAAILYFRSKDWRFLLAAIPQVIIYAKAFLVGRRSPTGEFVIIIVSLIFFYRRKTLPLAVLLPGMVALAVFSYNIGVIRSHVDESVEERVEAFVSADPLQALSEAGMIEEKRYIEIYNAVNFMDAKMQGGHYTYGLHFWNQLVFGFVPAQFVSEAFKKSLQFDLYDDSALTPFEKSNGTCESGIAESFMAFGYLGCVLFFLMGAGLRWLWHRSMQGSVTCQFILMLNMLPAVMSFTIQLWTMLNGLVSILVFAGPFLWWSAVRAPTGLSTRVIDPRLPTPTGAQT